MYCERNDAYKQEFPKLSAFDKLRAYEYNESRRNGLTCSRYCVKAEKERWKIR